MDTKDLGIVVITHTGHRRFLKPCLESCKKVNPAFIVTAYDCRYTANKTTPMENISPTYDTFILSDRWFMGDIGPRVNSWLWLTHAAVTIQKILGVKYIFSLNGDCVIDNPEGMHDLYEYMKKAEATIVCNEWRNDGFGGTTGYFATIDTAVKVADHLVENAYEARMPNGKAFGNPEGRMGKAIMMQDLKVAVVRNPEHAQLSYGDRGTFGDLLGFRHLHGAEKWRRGVHHTPFAMKYYDTRYLRDTEAKALEAYWDTGDEEVLFKYGYWQEISDTNRDMGIKYKEVEDKEIG